MLFGIFRVIPRRMNLQTTEEHPLPLLAPEEWVRAVEESDQGEELPSPFMAWVPPVVRGRMTLVGANTEVGKTCWGLQTFHGIVDSGYNGAYITTEMTPADVFERFRHQFEDDDACKTWIKDKNAIISQPGVDANEVVQIMREGFDFVVLDHVHDLPFEGHEDLARKVRRIASLAPYTNTALLMLAQTKQPDPLSPSLPSKYDFSMTKALVEVSALAFILHKEDDHSDIVDLHCVKNRFGPKSAPLSLRLDPHTVTFKIA
jgi:hypothetical protein